MPNRSESILILLGGVAIALVVVIANGERTEYRRIMREHDQEVYRANGWEWPDEPLVTSGPTAVAMLLNDTLPMEYHRTSGATETVTDDEDSSPALKLLRTWPITPTAPPASPRAPQPTPPEK